MTSQDLINKARSLRGNATDAERLLWRKLRDHQMQGFKFRRQQPIGKYIVDFVCFEKKLVIEVDGGQHAQEKEKDRVRADWLRDEGFVVMRFWNNEVLNNVDGVLEMIQRYLMSPHPDPLPRRGEG